MADTKKYLDLSGLTFLVNSIKDGSIKAGKAVKDADGNVITSTYATKAEIQALDATKSVGKDNGHQQIITGIEQVDGKLVSLSAATLDGTDITYTKANDETGPLSAATSIDEALKTLAAKASEQELAAADKSVVIGTAGGKTTVKVNIKTEEKVLTLDADNGLYTDIDLIKITENLPATVKERYRLLATDDTQIGADIDIAKDSHIVSITYINNSADTHYQNLEYVYINASGETQTTYVDMASLVLESEFASGVTATNHIVHGVVDSTSEKDSQGTPAAFLTVGADGFKISGIKAEIDRKINALDVSGDTAVAGQYVAAIQEADGIVSVKSRANVSDAVLTGYAKGTKPASTAIAATDDVKGAIAKIEHQIDDAKAAATTKVVEGADNAHLAISSAVSQSDSSTTYTITLDDVASDSALTAEINARKSVDGQNGQTYAANSSTNYISEATSLNNADVLLDTALKTEADRAKSAETAIDGAVGLTKGQNDETRTWTPTTNYKVSSGTHTVANNMQAIDTQVKTNEDAIALLNDDSATSGSVAYAIANAVEDTIDFITGTSADTSNQLTLNGLKTLIAEQGAASKTKVEDAVSNQKYVTVTKKTPGTGETFDTYTVGVSNIAAADAVGLNNDGTYKAFENANYISNSGIDSIAEAIEALDTAIGAVGDSSADTTVYGAIKKGDKETYATVLGVNHTGDNTLPPPTLWSLKKDVMDALAEATEEHTKVNQKTTGHVLVAVTETTVSGKTYDVVTVTEDDIASANLLGTLPNDAATYSANTAFEYAKNYTDVQVTALDESFQRITNTDIEALFSDAPAQSGD